MLRKLTLFLLLFKVAIGEPLKLLILHNNDMHAKFEEVTPKANKCDDVERNKTCVGGFARLAHEVRRYREEGEKEQGRHVLFLNAGDTFVGSDWYVVHKWKICADFLNALKPDVASLGNHEFDEGIEGLVPFLKEVKFPIVAANIDVSNEPSLESVKKSVVLNVNGTKVGIVGYLTQETSSISNSGRLNISDEISALKAETERLDREGIKVIIALGHSGFTKDCQIAKEVPLVDVVIGGHSNTFLWNGPRVSLEEPLGPYPIVVEQSSGKKVPVVQAYAFTLYLGRLNLTFDENGDLKEFGGQPEFIGADVHQDEDLLELLDKYRPEVMAINREVIGKSKVYLDGFCRLSECNFGNLITDAMVYYSAYHNGNDNKRWTNASVAIYNSGNIRNSINITYTNGTVTKGELMAALPFPNVVTYVRVRGHVLREILEHSVHDYNTNLYKAEFLQVSGLRVHLDLNREVGQRVTSLQVRCSECVVPTYYPLRHNETYTVIMTEYILNGGDGFNMIKDNAEDIIELDLSVYHLIEWYFSKQSPVFPEVQGRIRLVKNHDNSAANTPSFNLYVTVVVLAVANFIFS